MSLTTSSAERQLARLRNQISWVTRISTALSSTENVEDVMSVVLASLLSPTGLGYSRVLNFEYDDLNQLLLGKFALFHESTEAVEKLASEMREDASFVESWSKTVRRDNESGDEVIGEKEFVSLTSNAPWIILFQQLHRKNELTRQLKKLSFRTLRKSDADQRTLFENAHRWSRPRLMRKSTLGNLMPPALSQLIAEEFVLVPISTARGLRSVLLVDRYLDANSPFTDDDLSELDWFGRQASLAIENVEIRSDLAQSYREVMEFDQIKSNFLSVISHELRTPLTAMSGFVDLLAEGRVGEINENQRMLLGRVQKNTAHLIHLVNDLIEVAEIESEGTVEVRMGPVEPLGVLLDTLPRLEQRRRQKNVKVVPDIQCEVPQILTDERALGRIFFHLIDNAIKFSTDNSTVEVCFRIQDGEFHADIIDHGLGIAEENLKKIFNHFYQVDNTLTRGHEGLGLGLAVTKLLLHAARGRINVKSHLSKGSVFSVIFPLYEQWKSNLGDISSDDANPVQ